MSWLVGSGCISDVPARGSSEQEPGVVCRLPASLETGNTNSETLGRIGLPATQIGGGVEPSYIEIFFFGSIYLQTPPSGMLSDMYIDTYTD